MEREYLHVLACKDRPDFYDISKIGVSRSVYKTFTVHCDMEPLPIVMYFFRCFALSFLLSARSLAAKDFYSLSALDIHGNDVSLEKYRGKVILSCSLCCIYLMVFFKKSRLLFHVVLNSAKGRFKSYTTIQGFSTNNLVCVGTI